MSSVDVGLNSKPLGVLPCANKFCVIRFDASLLSRAGSVATVKDLVLENDDGELWTKAAAPYVAEEFFKITALHEREDIRERVERRLVFGFGGAYLHVAP